MRRLTTTRSAAAHAEAEARRSEVMAFSEDSGVGKETLERVYLYLKDKVHNKEPLEAADVKTEVFGPHGVDEQAGAELVPKVLQLILLEEDELLLKNLVKGVFVDDANDDVDESDDDLALAPVEAVLLAASKLAPMRSMWTPRRPSPASPPSPTTRATAAAAGPSPSPSPRPRRARRVATTTQRDAVDPRAEVARCKGGLNTTQARSSTCRC